jgi:hypothetical protein
MAGEIDIPQKKVYPLEKLSSMGKNILWSSYIWPWPNA